MDTEMEQLNGYQLCRMLRRIESLRKLPIVLLTERGGIVNYVRIRTAGATASLAKPMESKELLDLVYKLTGKHSLICL
jgi:twitching motility two-component system response regulator PilG